MMRSAFDRISNSRGSAIRQRGLPRKLPFIEPFLMRRSEFDLRSHLRREPRFGAEQLGKLPFNIVL